MMNSKLWSFLTIILLLSACTAQATCPTPISPTAAATKAILTETPSAPETIDLKLEGEVKPLERPYPNLWTKIAKDKITLYPYDLFTDYAVARDGSLWLTGGFGVVHQEVNGQQTWYSIKNGLPYNMYYVVAISPTGEVWIGGNNYALFRLDGQQWIDEGERLPQPLDDREYGWLCYSSAVSGIDFGPDGSAWVMNNGIEIYRQAYGQWINIPFPKNILPLAGGGACPKGIKVNAENDITIKIGPNGEAYPTGYHFDGQTWSRTKEYGIVDQSLNSKHSFKKEIQVIGDSISSSGLTAWPFSSNTLLPEALSPSLYSSALITTDRSGMLWLYDGSIDLYNISNIELSINNGHMEPDPKQSSVFGFGTEVIYAQKEKYPRSFTFFLPESIRCSITGIPLTVDTLDRIWFYHPQKGLVTVDHGVVNILGQLPNNQVLEQPGGVLPLQDGRIWVGGQGMVWELNKNQWRKMVLPREDQTFTYFAQDKQGVIYGATGEGVYQFKGDTFQPVRFVEQEYKPLIVPDDGKLEQGDKCSFHKHYAVTGNCPMFWGEASFDYQYKVLYLGIQKDDSVIYINNRIVAKLQDGEWKSFAFDTFSIDSATVDPNGNIWILSKTEGLFRLEASIFDEYQKLIH